MAEAGSPLVYGCNLVIVAEAGRTRAMVCSWATQVGDRHLLLCIGPQSETRAWLVEGKAFSLNVLLREQLDLARQAGTRHSSEIDKLAGIPVVVADDVVTLARAKKTMTCRVLRSLDVAPNGATRGILAEIVSAPQEQDGEPLWLDDVFRSLGSTA